MKEIFISGSRSKSAALPSLERIRRRGRRLTRICAPLYLKRFSARQSDEFVIDVRVVIFKACGSPPGTLPNIPPILLAADCFNKA